MLIEYTKAISRLVQLLYSKGYIMIINWNKVDDQHFPWILYMLYMLYRFYGAILILEYQSTLGYTLA